LASFWRKKDISHVRLGERAAFAMGLQPLTRKGGGRGQVLLVPVGRRRKIPSKWGKTFGAYRAFFKKEYLTTVNGEMVI